MWEEKQVDISKITDDSNFPLEWFDNKLNETKAEVGILMQQFKLSEALKTIYSLIWDDFCSWYLEWVKPNFGGSIEKEVYDKTVFFFEELVQLLHPFMPFVTEEIYHLLKEREDDLCVRQFSEIRNQKSEILKEGELLKAIITSIREAKAKNQIKPKEEIKLHIQTDSPEGYKNIEAILSKQLNACSISFTQENIANAIVVAVEKDKFFIESERQIDVVGLKDDLIKDLEHQHGFLKSVVKKLSNERFVQNAKPEVIELERKKQADAEARIKTIEESLANL
jgi:valyl-tRNA synthetase